MQISIFIQIFGLLQNMKAEKGSTPPGLSLTRNTVSVVMQTGWAMYQKSTYVF